MPRLPSLFFKTLQNIIVSKVCDHVKYMSAQNIFNLCIVLLVSMHFKLLCVYHLFESLCYALFATVDFGYNKRNKEINCSCKYFQKNAYCDTLIPEAFHILVQLYKLLQKKMPSIISVDTNVRREMLAGKTTKWTGDRLVTNGADGEFVQITKQARQTGMYLLEHKWTAQQKHISLIKTLLTI